MAETMAVHLAPEGSSTYQIFRTLTDPRVEFEVAGDPTPYLQGTVAVSESDSAVLSDLVSASDRGGHMWVEHDGEFVRIERIDGRELKCTRGHSCSLASIDGRWVELTLIEPSPPRADWYEPTRTAAIADYLGAYGGELGQEFEASRR